MIDSKAVVAHFTQLGDWSEENKGSAVRSTAAWLQDQLQQLSVEHHRDTEGNSWITTPGKSDRIVVLGSYLNENTDDALQRHVGLVSGLEIIRAVARRDDGLPPCTLQIVVWSSARSSVFNVDRLTPSGLGEKVAAYLELHMADEAKAERGSVSNTSPADKDAVALNARLMELCDEAVRELTGEPAPVPLRGQLTKPASEVPTAVMYFPALGNSTGQDALHLHLLQAAEAFGRWTESTMHLVAGDEVNLWAREGRIPQS